MKNIFTDSETFTAHATISAGLYMMQQAQLKNDKYTSQKGINSAIDKATGFEKKIMNDHYRFMAICLIDIIEAKKFLEVDCKKESELLAQFNEMVNKSINTDI